jgi:hypothetical protein
VVYENSVPANRIVVKMQTNVGDIDLGPFTNSSGTYDDPLFGDTNKTTPIIWKIQYLKDENWIDAASFDENSVRKNGNPIVGPDGYVELSYGLIGNPKLNKTFILNYQYVLKLLVTIINLVVLSVRLPDYPA